MKEKLTFELKKIKKEFVHLLEKQGKQKVILYLYIIFSLIAISIFGAFAIGPTLATISELRKEKEDAELTLDQLITKNQSLQKLGAQYETISGQIDSVYAAIPTSPKIPELTRKIEVIANKNSLTIDNLNTGSIEIFPAKRSGSPLFSYSINVTVIGTESDINSFIQEFINFDRILSIDKISSGEFERGLFSATITGRAFFIKG